MPKRILFLSWKDISHRGAGGAELLTNALAEHLAATSEVTYFTSSYPGARETELLNGYTIIRRGNIYTTYIHAWLWWHKKKRNYDCIVDQVHGFPFFSLLYVNHPPVITLVMEVAGELWNVSRLAFIGKFLEQAWLYMYENSNIVTISKSTKDELTLRNVSPEKIFLIPMFSNVTCEEIPKKAQDPTLLVVGRIAPVKRIEDAIIAYKIARIRIPSLRLVIIGKTEPAYEAYKARLVKNIQGDAGITLIENATEKDKQEWLKCSNLLLMTSKKEGYGLVILEAAACGTPAIGYNVGGIRDAILHTQTGILTAHNTPSALAESIGEILQDSERYATMQQLAFMHAITRTKHRTALAFEHILETGI